MQNENSHEIIKQRVKKARLDKIAYERKRAKSIGKEEFDLEELRKYWSYRYENTLTPEELAEDMKKVEEDYYFFGEAYKTMKEYGEALMIGEKYR